ncbi:NAD-dependent malic enzyme [Amycolatopsis sp. Poz14]|uniref:NAD-dependent malic enzyme n=1 Tax=Amycolatopsis sp. Poz14 TaxID=1447705 RepID=UPI001EE942BE|nr:NAD-dependent malic enzyme [Amycolatopsis sp. Poz14]
MKADFSAERIVVCDSKGVLHGERDLTGEKQWLAENTNRGDAVQGSLQDALRDADVFVGVSVGGLLKGDDLARMADRAIVFALANPDPEVDPDAAHEHAEIVATGRSDLPNQINNVLVFPGMFRGLLDSGAPKVTARMLLAASHALAETVGDDLDREHIVPSVFDEGLVPAIAEAVAGAADND